MPLFRKKNERLLEQFKDVLANKILDERKFDAELMALSTIIQNSNVSTNRKLDIYNLISKSRNSRGKEREKFLKKLKKAL